VAVQPYSNFKSGNLPANKHLNSGPAEHVGIGIRALADQFVCDPAAGTVLSFEQAKPPPVQIDPR